MLNKWKADFSGMPVHGGQGGVVQSFSSVQDTPAFAIDAGVFHQNNSISSTHAVLCKCVSAVLPACVLASSLTHTTFADLESAGAVCWVKDLGSRNKVKHVVPALLVAHRSNTRYSNCVPFKAKCLSLQTMLGRAGGLTVLQSRGDRYSVLPGDKLKFGNVETTISYSRIYHQVCPTITTCLALCKSYSPHEYAV